MFLCLCDYILMMFRMPVVSLGMKWDPDNMSVLKPVLTVCFCIWPCVTA